jgi:UTP--glucose-1-phosphate uridylyltransferase
MAVGIDALIFVTVRISAQSKITLTITKSWKWHLRAKGKNEIANMVKNILPEGIECVFVRQKE